MSHSGSARAPQLTPKQRETQRRADELGRALVTMIDGRVAIILPALSGDPEEQAAWIARVVAAVESVR